MTKSARIFLREISEVIKAYLDGKPIEIKFVHGKNVWEDFPKHFNLSAFEYYPSYSFRIKPHRVPVWLDIKGYGEETITLLFKDGELIKNNA